MTDSGRWSRTEWLAGQFLFVCAEYRRYEYCYDSNELNLWQPFLFIGKTFSLLLIVDSTCHPSIGEVPLYLMRTMCYHQLSCKVVIGRKARGNWTLHSCPLDAIDCTLLQSLLPPKSNLYFWRPRFQSLDQRAVCQHSMLTSDRLSCTDLVTCSLIPLQRGKSCLQVLLRITWIFHCIMNQKINNYDYFVSGIYIPTISP